MNTQVILALALLCCSCSAFKWESISQTGGPSPRFNFAYGYNDATKNLYIYGGQSTDGTLLSDFFIYNTATNVWEQITGSLGVVPPATSGSTGVVFGGSFYVISGEIAANEYLSTSFIYDDATNTWSTFSFEPIIGASAFNYADEYLYYFGGLWASSTGLGYSDDLYVNYGNQWYSIVVDTSPPGREYTAMTHTPPPYNRTFIYGGFNGTDQLNDMWFMFDTGLFEFKTWYQIPKQYYPWPQATSGSLMVYDDVSEHIVLFGGGNSSSIAVNDVWVFSLYEQSFNLPTQPEGGVAPPGRMNGGIATTDEGILIFYGTDGSQKVAFNDMWLLTDI